MEIRTYFKSVMLTRMSNGDYCIIRDLGLVPGGKGMRHHDTILRLTPAGIFTKLIGRAGKFKPAVTLPLQNSAEASVPSQAR